MLFMSRSRMRTPLRLVPPAFFEPLRAALRPLASTPDRHTLGVDRRSRPRDDTVQRVVDREPSEPRKRRRGVSTLRPKGRRCGPFGGKARRSSKNRAPRLRYDPRYSEGPSVVNLEPAAPPTWRCIDDRNRRPCASAASGLPQQCLRRRSVGGTIRGGEEFRKPNANNNLDALHWGWPGALVTYITNERIRVRPSQCQSQQPPRGGPAGRLAVNPTLGGRFVTGPKWARHLHKA